jgi:hypothetical protein
MTFRLIFAVGFAVAVLHGFSSAAWAAYWGTPGEVPYWLGVAGTLGAIVVGLLLFTLRCWQPFYYGALEIIAALFTIYFSIVPAKQAIMTVCNGSVFWGVGCYFQSSLIILAGIYIFVRGMDNMGRQLPNWVPDSVRRFWHRVFRGNAPGLAKQDSSASAKRP